MFVYFTHCCDLLTFFWEKFNIYFGCWPIPSIQHFEGFIVLCQFPMADYSYLLEKAVWNGSLYLPYAKAVSDGWLFILAREGSLKWLTIPTCTRRQFQMADYSYLHACTKRQFPMADYSYMHEKAVWNEWLFLPAQEGSFKWLIIPICTFAGERQLCVMWWELVTFSQWGRAWLKQQILISLSSKTCVGGTRVRRLILAKP